MCNAALAINTVRLQLRCAAYYLTGGAGRGRAVVDYDAAGPAAAGPLLNAWNSGYAGFEPDE